MTTMTSDAETLRKVAQINDIGRLVAMTLMVCERRRGEEEYDALQRQISLECALYVSGAHTYGEAVNNIQRALRILALALDVASEPLPE